MNNMKNRILIVEDDALLADVYKKALEAEGFKASIAKNHTEAIKLFKPKTLALVTLDIILHGKNGFELLRDFRKQPDGDKVPIVIITGMNTQELTMDKDLMVSLNIIGIHTKSQFSIKEFVGIITAYLQSHER